MTDTGLPVGKSFIILIPRAWSRPLTADRLMTPTSEEVAVELRLSLTPLRQVRR